MKYFYLSGLKNSELKIFKIISLNSFRISLKYGFLNFKCWCNLFLLTHENVETIR